MQKRIDWLDSSRGIAFLMVMYSHLEFCNQHIMQYFSPIFLTTFFFVSGYLFKSGYTFKNVLEQRIRTLLIPFLIYGTLMLVLRQILSFHETVTPFKEAFINMITQNGKDHSIWFIPALFVYSLFFYWVEHYCQTKSKLLIAALILVVTNWSLSLFSLPIYYSINVMGYACAYMALGKAYKLSETNTEKYMCIKYVIPVCIIYIIAVWADPQRISFYGSKYLLDAIFITLLGLYICIYLSKKILLKSKLIMFVGANSLLYFCLHGKVYSLVQTIIHKCVDSSCFDNVYIFSLTGFLVTLVSALILIIPVWFINKYLPFTIGKGYKLF